VTTVQIEGDPGQATASRARQIRAMQARMTIDVSQPILALERMPTVLDAGDSLRGRTR
jgi:hypothetical protein